MERSWTSALDGPVRQKLATIYPEFVETRLPTA
jgi:hypothetical protein